ncbi:ZF-HD homeobox protein [Macleaya cordata]|uniref:ZF-HD homeobox protein n=1 Tax=Macleaya cordata TaxID=56857 RepID=A0A200QYG0_MACCD|nr:ZF-HD homeobox protein [Macleaya cordata]
MGHEIPIPINSTYGGGHGHGHGHIIHHDPPPHPHNHIIPSSAPQLPSNGPIPPTMENHMPYKKLVKYRECLKNHAAAMGGNATDGCGEFMPSGEEGTLEALKCSACNCHRNFHRKEIEGEASSCDCYHHPHINKMGRKIIVGHHKVLGSEALGYPSGTILPSRAQPLPHNQVIMSYNLGSLPSESDEQEGGGDQGILVRPTQMVKKRYRTKFTQEQKEKMLNFAEKVGWRIQKQEESVVQQFCQEIGVKRRVLKVWMHNNKHNLAKKNNSSSTT